MSQPSFTSVAELQRKIAKYFKHCEQSGDFPSVLGLCVSMRITRETLRVYAHDKKYSDTIKRAKDEIYYKKYQSAAKGDMDVRVFMFDCINNDRDMINTRSEQKSKTELTGKDGERLIPADTITPEERVVLQQIAQNYTKTLIEG